MSLPHLPQLRPPSDSWPAPASASEEVLHAVLTHARFVATRRPGGERNCRGLKRQGIGRADDTMEPSEEAFTSVIWLRVKWTERLSRRGGGGSSLRNMDALRDLGPLERQRYFSGSKNFVSREREDITRTHLRGRRRLRPSQNPAMKLKQTLNDDGREYHGITENEKRSRRLCCETGSVRRCRVPVLKCGELPRPQSELVGVVDSQYRQ
jgi:hypothetical protein